VTRFDRDTAPESLGEGRYRVAFEPEWFILRGPNGGIVAATIVRAMRAELGSDERALRSLAVHYPGAPAEGPAEVHVRVERAGRSLSTVSARLEQDGRVMALALAAFSVPFGAATEYDHARPPDVPAPEAIEATPDRGVEPLPFVANFEFHPAIGPRPLSGEGDRPITGGWVRLAEERPLDEALVVAYADAWWPAPFSVVARTGGAPTIDLTVHVRAPLPREHDDVLIEVGSDVLRDGFFEEDVRLWARDGTLLAQARQLALLLPAR